ncbi:hypothetical protein DY000_02021200 [Brassica cretica]|uniref:Pentatricopeptide repeat-containing protein n=1 Tax=Brassica cretica TaxID=69181 RepID=A0ABQ7EGJ7_BRACR|nr:hypothetical protein DY000_02021200 [Brassica cretica]
MRLTEELRLSEFEVDEAMYRTLIEGCYRAGRVDNALEVVAEWLGKDTFLMLPVRRGGCREPEPQPVAEGDEIRSAVSIGYNRDECEPVPGDDCEAIVDDPGDEIEEYENESKVSSKYGFQVVTSKTT